MHVPESLQDLADSEAVQFLKKPKTMARVLEAVFSLIVFSSLLTDGYQNKTDSPQLQCVLNSNNVACSFAVGAGFLAFLSSLAFLVLDAHEDRIASTRFKTAFQLLDFILAEEATEARGGCGTGHTAAEQQIQVSKQSHPLTTLLCSLESAWHTSSGPVSGSWVSASLPTSGGTHHLKNSSWGAAAPRPPSPSLSSLSWSGCSRPILRSKTSEMMLQSPTSAPWTREVWC
ncbi:synaptogyrin-4 isoform X2 [Tamandua tetradactyla]|uniref:synaptogyrin-4 isoform X2 n=1 Tax=Tamandua tetradactyla TaxID=48850 RepID=UPI0040540F8F